MDSGGCGKFAETRFCVGVIKTDRRPFCLYEVNSVSIKSKLNFRELLTHCQGQTHLALVFPRGRGEGGRSSISFNATRDTRGCRSTVGLIK